MKTNKLLILSLMIILSVLILSTTIFSVTASNTFTGENQIDSILTTSLSNINAAEINEPRILISGNVKINLTGFDIQKTSETQSTNGGFSATYLIKGQGDNFTLTITAIPESDLTNYPNQSDISSHLNIHRMHYFISIIGGNSQHHNQNFLDSIILTHSSSDTPSTSSSQVSDDPYYDYNEEGLEGEPMEDPEDYQ